MHNIEENLSARLIKKKGLHIKIELEWWKMVMWSDESRFTLLESDDVSG